MDTWLGEFLDIGNRRQLKNEGKPFYKYKVTDQEYYKLKELLNEYAEKLRIGVGFTSIEYLFQIYLVLYAAEWWRREYQGGHWKWEPIFNSFGVTKTDFLPPVKRNQYIEKGVNYWKLKLKNEGKKYLGTIALNGGLPISLITGSSRVTSLIDRLMLKVGANNYEKYLISDLIETDYKHYLPATYRIGHIYDLIAEIISISIEITTKYELKHLTNPIVVLDTKNPDWRDDYPISLNEKEGQQLIDSLILSTFKRTDTKKASFFDVKYILELDEDPDVYVLHCEIEINDLIKEEHLQEKFQISKDSLSPYYVLVFDFGANGEFEVDLNLIFGKRTYKPNKLAKKWKITGWFDDGIFPNVYLRDRIGLTYQLLNKNLAQIEPPVIVFSKLDSNIEYRFSGDGKLEENNAIVLITTKAEYGNDFKLWGKLRIGTQNFELLETRQNSSLTVNSSDGIYIVNIKLNSHVDKDEEDLCLIGNQVNGLINTSIPVYRGEPTFRKNGKLLNVDWFQTGTNTQVFKPLGYVTAKVSSSYGYIKRKRLLILPSQSKVAFKERIGNSTCIYDLHKWGNDISFAVDDSYKLELVESDINFHRITIEKKTYDHKYLDLRLTLRSNSFNRSIELQLPWFASSVICMDRFNVRIQSGSFLNVENLHGIRILGSLKNQDKIKLLLEVDSVTLELWEPYISDEGTFSLNLNDFKREIKKAIEYLKEVKSEYDDLGTVKLTTYIRDRRELQLNFPPYYFSLEENNNKIKVTRSNTFTSDEYHNLLLKFIPANLDYEEQKEIEIDLNEWIDVESIISINTNYLAFCQTENGMSSPQIELKRGPDVTLSSFEEYSLLDISMTSFSDEKVSILNSVLNEMKEDLNSRWWIELEDIVSTFGHLRWRKIEIIKKFVHDPRLVSISMLNIESKKLREFILNLINQSPPFIMKVSTMDWELAFDLTYKKAQELVLNREWAEKIYMQKTHELFQIDAVELFSLLPVLVKSNPARYTEIATNLNNTIFQFSNDDIGRIFVKNASSTYQKLLRKTHQNQRFPDSTVCEAIAMKVRTRESEILNELVAQLENFNHSVLLAAPVLMAEYIFTNRTHELSNEFYSEVLKIKKYDPDWYNSVFKSTLNHFASNG